MSGLGLSSRSRKWRQTEEENERLRALEFVTRDENERLRTLNAELVEALGEIANHEVSLRYDVATTVQRIAEAAIAKAKEQK